MAQPMTPSPTSPLLFTSSTAVGGVSSALAVGGAFIGVVAALGLLLLGAGRRRRGRALAKLSQLVAGLSGKRRCDGKLHAAVPTRDEDEDADEGDEDEGDEEEGDEEEGDEEEGGEREGNADDDDDDDAVECSGRESPQRQQPQQQQRQQQRQQETGRKKASSRKPARSDGTPRRSHTRDVDEASSEVEAKEEEAGEVEGGSPVTAALPAVASQGDAMGPKVYVAFPDGEIAALSKLDLTDVGLPAKVAPLIAKRLLQHLKAQHNALPSQLELARDLVACSRTKAGMLSVEYLLSMKSAPKPLENCSDMRVVRGAKALKASVVTQTL